MEKERQETDRERERSIGRGETRVSDSEGVRTKERKSERAYYEREKAPKNYISCNYKWI